MNKVGVVLLGSTALLLPAIASAQDASLEICNTGRLDIHVAVAARIQTFITGYKWTTNGWYSVPTGQCVTVYDHEYDAAGPYTPQSGARIAFIVTRADGVRGAFQSGQAQGQGWMRSGTGQICVNSDDAFTFEEPSGDPAANCKDILIPVANDFMPEGPGTFTYTMNWDGIGSFVACGKDGQPRSSVVNSGASDSVDNSLGSQFVRALGQAAKNAQIVAAKNAAKDATNDGVPADAHDHSSIQYLCSSTDPKQPAIYFSDIFELPDAGSKADNFMEYERAKIHFQMYLVESYKYSGAEDLVDCGWMSTATVADAAAAMHAKKQSMMAQVVAARKQVVETGWKDAEPVAAKESATAEATRADVEALNARGRAAILQWVREDLAAYIDASKSGFKGYRSGEAQLSQGYHMWTSSVKPAAATGCWVIQGDTASTLSCVLALEKSAERAYNTELTNDVAASLPSDWSQVAETPFGGNLPSTGYRSSSGAHGEIWLAQTAAGEYELYYQLVSAPSGPKPPNPSDDDPIGEGGLITPPTPPVPPTPPN